MHSMKPAKEGKRGTAMNTRGARWVGVSAVGAALLGLAWTEAVRAQGFIVDRRPAVPVGRSYEIREVSIDARVRDQLAEVQVAQTFHNPGSIQIESEFLFPLPEDGAVQNFVLLVDGRELPGRLMNKDEARRIYEEIVPHQLATLRCSNTWAADCIAPVFFRFPRRSSQGDHAVHPALPARPRRH